MKTSYRVDAKVGDYWEWSYGVCRVFSVLEDARKKVALWGKGADGTVQYRIVKVTETTVK